MNLIESFKARLKAEGKIPDPTRGKAATAAPRRRGPGLSPEAMKEWLASAARHIREAEEERKNGPKLARLRRMAEDRGGRLLSEKYPGMAGKARWSCSAGHEWEAAPSSIAYLGTWCPKCAHPGKCLSVPDLERIAAGRGGSLLPGTFSCSSKKAGWRCSAGHEWKASPSSVALNGTWCPKCANRGRGKTGIETLRGLAAARGGECLSGECHGVDKKARWRCSEGHEWDATPSSIAHVGTWCPKCANRGPAKLTMEDMRGLAASRGGECLSGECPGSNKKMRWRCSEGHEWLATPSSLKHTGTWCPECTGAKGEAMARQAIESASGLGFPKTRPKWLTRNKPLELDMYSDAAGLAVEWQGSQHYRLIPRFHESEADLADQIERDALKSRLCAARGVLLLAVPAPSVQTPAKVEAALVKAAEAACMPIYGINREYTSMVDSMAARA